MALYTLSDPHLSCGVDKPMDIFGGTWQNYMQKLDINLKKILTPNDVIIFGGDISWGINLKESLADFKFLEQLPAKKIILKGNHDLWWESLSKMNKFLEDNNIKSIDFLFNNYIAYKNLAICGTRGWLFRENFTEDNDKKIYARELLRLENSLNQAKSAGFDDIIVVLHYPVIYGDLVATEFIEIMQKYNVQRCVYGHLHGHSLVYGARGKHYGIDFFLASSDFINFCPLLLEK